MTSNPLTPADVLAKSEFRYWCQACGSYGAPGDGPCDVPGHRSEKLYFNRAYLKYTRYSPPRVTEAKQSGNKIEHVKVKFR